VGRVVWGCCGDFIARWIVAKFMFVKKCINGITINKSKIEHNLNNSLMLVTALSPKIGYAKAAEIAKYAFQHNLTLKAAALKLQYVSAKDFDKLVDPKKMV
jgi:fumarate hydratase class II